jgi:hypothetical protein
LPTTGGKVQSPSSSSLSDQNEHEVAPLVPNLETPPLDARSRSSGFKNDRLASNRPSIGREIFHALIRLFIGVWIAVGGVLSWQSYGDEATNSVRTWVPSLAWLLPVATPKSSPDREVSTQDAALLRSAPTPAPAVSSSESVQQLEPITHDLAAMRRSLEQLAVKQEQMAQALSSSESVQQLEPITNDLAAMRRSLEQLAVKQEQMAQNVATLQTAVEQDIKRKMSSPLPSQAVPLPQRKPPHAAR